MCVIDWPTFLGILGALGGIAAAAIAWFQLSNLNQSLNASNLMAIFEIEFELNRRKERLSEIRKENETLLLNVSKPATANEKAAIKMLEGHRKEAYENYLNIFDRLCYFVLQKRLNEEDFRLEYRDMLFQTIEKDGENNFNNGSKFRNMLKLYNSWKEK